MNRSSRFAFVAVAALAFLAGAFAFNHAQPPADQDVPLPPGWTMDDMMKMMQAGTPGEMHEVLTKGAGEWSARTTMWMTPGAEPVESDGRCVVTPLMDGRFVKVEMTGDMPGMGTYQGMGIYGYNNITEEYEAIWIDNHSTSMMRGIGKISSDRTKLTWDFHYTCPLTHKPTKLREIERFTGPNSKTLEMHGADAKTGVEYKMMEIKFTRKSAERVW